MIDPITALSVAAGAVSNIKSLIAAGQDASQHLAKFAGAWSDIQKAEESAKNPPWYKSFSSSAESQAAEIFAARKKMQQMKSEVEQMIQLMHGPRGLEEYKNIVRETKKRREQQVYRAQKIKETIISACLATLIVVVGTLSIGTALYYMFEEV